MIDGRIYLVGFMGAGKSVVGKMLANALDAPFFDTDVFIEKIHKKTIGQIFSESGEEYFRRIERNIIRQFSKANGIIATGGGTPCYYDNMDIMNEEGNTVYLQVNPKVLETRLQANGLATRPILYNLTGPLLERIQSLLNIRENYYLRSNVVIPPNLCETVEITTQAIISRLEEVSV